MIVPRTVIRKSIYLTIKKEKMKWKPNIKTFNL